MSDLSIKKAALINFIAKYSNLFIQITYTSILSRILTPEDFGIVAITSVFIIFFMLFADMGIGSAVIQNKSLTKNDIESIFSFSVYLGVSLAILFGVFSIPLSLFYENDVYIPIGLLLTLSIFFNTLNIIPNAILLKSKKFKTVGYRLVIVTLVSSIITIFLALKGFKYYSIVLNSIISALFIFLWNYKSVKIKFHFKINKESILKIKDFSTFQLAFSVVNYFSRNLDNLLIGKFIGNVPLAYYDKSYKLTLYPVNNLTHVITPVLHPILSEHQNDKKFIYTQYRKVVKVLSLLGVFITVFCFFSSKELILIFYGDQWLNAVPSFSLLALTIWSQMLTSSTGSIFQSLGNTRLMFICGVFTSFLTVTAIIIGVSFQSISAVALSLTIVFNLNFIITNYILVKFGFGYKLMPFLKQFIPDMIIALITVFALYAARFIPIENFILSAFVKGIIGGLAYVLGILLTNQYKMIKLLLTRKV